MASVPGRLFLRNLVERRSLLYQLVRRDFEQRFVGSAGGWLWSLVQPLVLLASWTFVFQVCLRIPLPEGSITRNYPLYLFCGYLPWLLFADTVQRSSSSLLENANLLTKTVFPAEMIPISIFCSSLVSHLLALTLAVTAVIFGLNHFSVTVFLLPLYMVLVGLLAVGVGWVVAALQVYLRDTAQVLGVALTFWFWMTPIFIAEEQVPAALQWLVRLNPLAYAVRAYRGRLLSHDLPSMTELAVLAGFAVAAFVAGGLVFRHLKRGFADVL